MQNIFSLPFKIRKMDSMFERRANELLIEKAGITSSQFMIMVGVFKCDGLGQKTIASHLKLTESAVSRQIENLVQEGMLERLVNPKNRRERILNLSKKGKEVFINSEEILTNLSDQVFGVLSESEIKQLKKILNKLLIQ